MSVRVAAWLALAMVACADDGPSARRARLDVSEMPSEWAALIEVAASRWNAAAGCTVLEVGMSGGVPVRLWDGDGGLHTGAMVLLPQLGSTRSDSWAADLAAHELGHVLGFGHVTLPWCVMHPDVGGHICSKPRCP